ncbi:MAG: DUF1367 family protein [Thermoplasmata archaeon]
MKLLLRNTEQGLLPEYPSDLDEKKKLKLGVLYSVEIRRERNPLFHRKFMALCKLGCENSKNVEMPFDAYRKYVTMKAGYFKTYKTPKGVMVEPESIAFANMDEDKFNEVYNKVLNIIVEDIQATKEDIEQNLLSFF